MFLGFTVIIPTSLGKTYSSASNTFGIVPLTSPTLLLFPDDPYMKALQAFYTEKSPVLSPISTPSQPQVLEIGETSRKLAIKHHEEQIQGIQGYLEEIPPERFEQIENGIEGLEVKLAKMASVSNPNRNIGPTGTPAVKTGNYKEFISCQPFYFNGTEGAVGLIRWFERTESVFSRSRCANKNKVTFLWKMEEELYNLIVKGNDLKPYVRRFQELTVLCPNMVPNNDKLLEAFIGGLPRSIEGNVTASKPQTLEEAINIAQRLMDQDLSRQQNYAYTTNATTIVKQTKLKARSGGGGGMDRAYAVTHRKRVGMPEISLCARDAISITTDLVLANVIFATRKEEPYMLRDKNAQQDPNVVTDTLYNIEMADGNLVSTNTIIKGCTLTLLNQPFEIDLMPIKLGSFGRFVIVMDVFMIQVVEKKADEKRLEDIPVVKEFPDVFPEDLPGIPPVRTQMQELSNDNFKERTIEGFIQPSTMPWGAPVLILLKERRIFQNVACLPEIEIKLTIKKSFTIARIEDLFGSTARFSVDKIRLISVYHQLSVNGKKLFPKCLLSERDYGTL
ncbi:hypothetical protein Tco_1376455 [Tanacetum coccineum]